MSIEVCISWDRHQNKIHAYWCCGCIEHWFEDLWSFFQPKLIVASTQDRSNSKPKIFFIEIKWKPPQLERYHENLQIFDKIFTLINRNSNYYVYFKRFLGITGILFKLRLCFDRAQPLQKLRFQIRFQKINNQNLDFGFVHFLNIAFLISKFLSH